MGKLVWMLQEEVHEDAAAIAVAEGDGTLWDILIGPFDVIFNREGPAAWLSEAGDMEHDGGVTVATHDVEGLLPVGGGVGPTVDDVESGVFH